MLFLQIGAHDPLQTNKPKQISMSECARTHAVMSQQDSLKRWDFKDDLKDMNVFDDLTLQGKLFQTDSAAYMKKSLTRWMHAESGKTKNGSIKEEYSYCVGLWTFSSVK